MFREARLGFAVRDVAEKLDQDVEGFLGSGSRAKGAIPLEVEHVPCSGVGGETEELVFGAGAGSDCRVKKGKRAIDVEERAQRPDEFVFLQERFAFGRQWLHLERGSAPDQESHLAVDLAARRVAVVGETLP